MMTDWNVSFDSSPGMGRSGLGGCSFSGKTEKWSFDYNLCHNAFEMDFLLHSSIVISKASLQEKKMKGM